MTCQSKQNELFYEKLYKFIDYEKDTAYARECFYILLKHSNEVVEKNDYID